VLTTTKVDRTSDDRIRAHFRYAYRGKTWKIFLHSSDPTDWDVVLGLIVRDAEGYYLLRYFTSEGNLKQVEYTSVHDCHQHIDRVVRDHVRNTFGGYTIEP
jgi:hypothetical protein